MDDPPAIQPHGFLIGLSDEWLVKRASANTDQFLGRVPEDIVGSAATDIFSVEAVHALRNRVALLRGPDAVERLFRCRLPTDERDHDVAVHVTDGETILEAEPSTGKNLGDISGTIRGMIQRLDGADSLAQLLDGGISQLRALTGFDRVAIRRFDADGSNRVVAQSARGGMVSLSGEAIDTETLEIYRRAATHLIADVDAASVRVIPSDLGDGQPVDLSLAVLRAPAPQEVERLRAAGAQAAMTIGLHAGGSYWGLIECHHRFARSPGFERRAMADLFAQMFALRIRIRELEGDVA